MFRYLLLLFLATPLLLNVYGEVIGLFGTSFRGTPLSDEALAERDQALKGADEAASKLSLRDSLVVCVVGLGEDCPVVAGNPTENELRPTLDKYATQLKDAHTFFTAYGADDPTPNGKNPCSNDVLRNVLKDRQTSLTQERAVKLARERLLEATSADERTTLANTLKMKVDDLEAQPGHSPKVVRESRALLARLTIEKNVEHLEDDVKRVLSDPEPKVAPVSREVGNAVDRLDEFVKAYGTVKKEIDWGQTELARWKAYQTLLRLAEQDDSKTTPTEFAQQIRAYAALLDISGLPEKVRELVRPTALRYCKRFLAPEKLDDDVYLGKDKVRRKRSDIMVYWIDGKKSKLEDPSKPTQNEFTIDTSKVSFFSVGKDDFPATPITGTERSKTASKFNEEREKLEWTEPSLRNLKDIYSRLEKPDDTTRKRLDALVTAAQTYSKLFRAPR